ncbi:MAG TPA: type IV pilus biogenesis protein PilM [Noviherbaspirillum sp.]|nr:type IV pilus biogenesis protein PilM [Noviherbaspirillum sp.]
MWSMVVVAMMAGLVGYYIMPAQRSIVVMEDMKARELADNMGIYRAAVVDYFSANPHLLNTSVPIGTLTLPDWSTGSAMSLWANYRGGDGTIYIYPTDLPPVNIVFDVLQLSRGSYSVGVYRAADNSLYSPVDGTRVTYAALGSVSVPDGAPVWLAARK